ncbi:MAG: extracellular solute-binding protein [Oscillospiraceae bacterium]|jgi:ABC-type glycerol-3-phosphate transport system substrate-binding protein|nr:extracellular solute-binding protein [Oscillospiraceae bacterium]
MRKGRKIAAVLILLCAAAAAVIYFAARSGGYEDSSFKYAGANLADGEAAGSSDTYAQYRQEYNSVSLADEDIHIDILAFSAAEDAEERGGALYTGGNSSVAWAVSVPSDALYQIEIEYEPVPSRGVAIERALLINDELPFAGSDALALSRVWTDGGAVRQDNRGNDIRPEQVERAAVMTAFCKDALGYEADPYLYFFKQGENTLRLDAVSEPMIIRAVTLKAAPATPSYEEYRRGINYESSAVGYAEGTVYIQGEDAQRRSSPSLYARYDHSSSATEPYSVTTTLLNFIGGAAWNKAGQWIEWDFDVPADGFYNITIKGRQNYSRGSLSCRAVYIDGEILFDEMRAVAFEYMNAWNQTTLSDAGGMPCEFYLTEGTHTIRLEATLGRTGAILSDMQASILRLNQIYRKILVLTGVRPDVYRDYHIEDTYPEVIEAIELESKRLFKLVDDTVAITGQKTDRIAVAQTLANQLERFAKDPALITKQFVPFKDNVTALGTSLQTMSETPLDVDLIIVSPVGTEIKKASENWLTGLVHEARSLIASYTVDYNSLGDVYEGEDARDAIEVWIMTGRDQSAILKALIDDSFTPLTGIKVNVKLVDPNALLPATVAGNGPDVVVSCDSWNPVNYALRNAAVDLTAFDDFDEVIGAFYPSGYAQLTLDGGVYGLPETQLCSVLYYRSDILAELGLAVPETWDDLIAMMPTIQGNSLSVGIPYPDIVNPNLSVLYAMIYQNGGTIYDAGAEHTLIDDEAGVAAFKRYTQLYTNYGLPTIFDFASRFRSGEMPLGISDYTTYNLLTVSAPEIRGLWSFALLPGTKQTDGTISHAGHSQGVSTMMIQTDDETIRQNGWEFMKWWVSADTQVRFGREIEALLGSSARYPTANREALGQLAWSAAQLDVIQKQMEQAVGFREIAGGYYTNRHITNAVRKVTIQRLDPRETLQDYARTINEEIEKKRREFAGLEVTE